MWPPFSLLSFMWLPMRWRPLAASLIGVLFVGVLSITSITDDMLPLGQRTADLINNWIWTSVKGAPMGWKGGGQPFTSSAEKNANVVVLPTCWLSLSFRPHSLQVVPPFELVNQLFMPHRLQPLGYQLIETGYMTMLSYTAHDDGILLGTG